MDVTKWFLSNESCEALSHVGAKAAGSCVLAELTKSTWTPGDLDIYVHVRGLSRAENAISTSGYALKSKIIAPEYRNSGFMRMNGIRSITSFERPDGLRAQVIAIRHNRQVEAVIQNFDLSVCSVSYDFGTKAISFHGVTAGDIAMRSMVLRKDYVNKYFAGNSVLHDRIEKYTSRGFKLEAPSLKDHWAAMRERYRVRRAEFLEPGMDRRNKRARLLYDNWRARKAAREALVDIDSDE